MTSSLVALSVDTTSLEKGDKSPIWGRVHLLVDGVPFPGTSWTDIAVGVAASWIQAIRRLSEGKTDQELVHFFDGPFAARLTKMNAGGVQVDCIDRHEPEKIVRSATSSLADLLRDAESIGEDVIKAVEGKNWTSDADVKFLMQDLRPRDGVDPK